MGILKRIFKVGQAETHAIIDKIEDPIKMTEQGIRDLKKDLDKSLQALAEVKALAIRSKRELSEAENKAQNYEHKAILLIQKAEKGEISPDEADRLATEALTKKEECVQDAARSKDEVVAFDKNISQLEANVKKLRSTISKYENELKTLKARAKVAAASKKINRSMSNIDSSSTVSMLEKMKDKVAQDEAMADAYGEIAGEARSLDDEIDAAIGSSSSVAASDALAELKNKLKQKS